MFDKSTRDACTIRDEISNFLKSAVADQGKSMDTGGGAGGADLWFTVGGKEYTLTVRPCRQAKDARP
jgi:hypothetical protein